MCHPLDQCFDFDMLIEVVDDVEVDSANMPQDNYARVAHVVILTLGNQVESELCLNFSCKSVSDFD